jgi:hypothetical protein
MYETVGFSDFGACAPHPRPFSPEGRGEWGRLATARASCRHRGVLPLPSGERVGVRGGVRGKAGSLMNKVH